MNKKIIGLIIAVLIVGGGIAIAMSRHNTSSNGMGDMSMAASSSSANGKPSSSANSIDIKDYEYAPKTTQVKVGTTITWTNQDSVQHTVTMDNGADGPKSGNFGKGQTYSYKFTKAGTYAYHCEIHPSMRATVTVSE